MRSSKMVRDSQAYIYTALHRQRHAEGFLGFLFATAINTVFTDEVMQLVLRGQQQEAGDGHPGVARWRGEVQE